MTAYPLTWPVSRQRTNAGSRKRAAFKTSFAKARDQVAVEVKRMNGRELVISSNIPLKNDGFPYANARQPDDCAIAVYFTRNGKRFCFACDLYNTTHDNMHAITLTIGALRGIARWGTGDMMESAISGFAALPEKGQGMAWYDVLRVPHNADAEQIKSAFRLLVKVAHPDVGGTQERWLEINEAYSMGMQSEHAR